MHMFKINTLKIPWFTRIRFFFFFFFFFCLFVCLFVFLLILIQNTRHQYLLQNKNIILRFVFINRSEFLDKSLSKIGNKFRIIIICSKLPCCSLPVFKINDEFFII